MATLNLDQFCRDTSDEFEVLGDYIWKMNRQIDTLRDIEIEKLQGYRDPQVRAWRQKREFERLDYWFPITLGYSSVVQIFIVLETRLRRTCNILHETRNLSLKAKDLSGAGLDRYMIFLDKLCGVPKNNLLLWPQIVALIKTRDCLVHTSGFIQDSRDADAIRKFIKDRSYLSQEHRDRRKELEENEGKVIPPEISIHKLDGEERLTIMGDYPFVTCFYARDFMEEIFKLSGMRSK